MKKILYLGTDPKKSFSEEILHYQVLKLCIKESERLYFCIAHLDQFSHVLITSKNTVSFLSEVAKKHHLDISGPLQRKCISIGPATSEALRCNGIDPLLECSISTQEGMIELLEKIKEQLQSVFYPRSSMARSVMEEYLKKQKISHEILDLYDTFFQKPLPVPSLETIEEIIFTSPSTIEGFIRVFGKIPEGKKISCQGPVTASAFEKIYHLQKFVESK